MMKKMKTMMATLALASLTSISVYAGSWANNAQGWWYNNGDGTWPANTWQWIDGNNDGIAECYYFDANGYCLMNTTTPGGYKVDSNGAWIVNGTVKTTIVGNTSATSNNAASSIADGTYRVSFKQSDIQKSGGQYTITFTAYTEKTFSKSYVMGLKTGDTVEGIKIYSISRQSDSVWINNSSLSGAPCWFTKVQGSNDLYTFGYEDGYTVWNTIGQYTLPVASNATFIDKLYYYDKGTQNYSFSEFANNSALFEYGFHQEGTGITVKNGVVTEVERYYMP